MNHFRRNKKLKMEVLKENGNDEFKNGQFQKAVEHYSQAIKMTTDFGKLSLKESEDDVANLRNLIKSNDCLQKCLNNRSQCYLKLGKYKEAVEDATNVLLATPDDTKALFRRSQAYKELNKLEESLQDVRRLIKIDPKNKPALELIQVLTRLYQDKLNEQHSTKNKVKSMIDFADGETGEKKLTVSF